MTKRKMKKAKGLPPDYEKALEGNPDAERIRQALKDNPDTLRPRHDVSIVPLQDDDLPAAPAQEDVQNAGQMIAGWLLAIQEPALIVMALLLMSGQSGKDVSERLGVSQPAVTSAKKKLIAMRPELAPALNPPKRRYPFFTPVDKE